MRSPLVASWILLFRMDLVMRFRDFAQLHKLVRIEEIKSCSPDERVPSEILCAAAYRASVFYFKPVLCLQRSAVTALLLRRHGWDAQLVIGAKLAPFKSHAWVEIGGVVVNDKKQIVDSFSVVERC